MIKELGLVALTCDLPEHGLREGDLGTVVLLHGDDAYGVEFMDSAGDTVAVVSLTKAQVRPSAPGEMQRAHLPKSKE